MKIKTAAMVVAVTSLIGCEGKQSVEGVTDAKVETMVNTSSPQVPRYKTEEWIQGAQFMGANGMYFSPQGQLHLASVVTSMIFVVDHETGQIVSSYGADKGVANPDDIAFSSDGLLCWTGIVPGNVGCIRPDGSHYLVAQLGANTAGPNPITFSHEGRLFVGECFFGFEMYELDPTGNNIDKPRLITKDAKLGPSGPYQKCGFNGMDIGPDEYLYGPRWFDGEVVRMNVDNGRFTTHVGGFKAPAAVKFDAQNRLHVVDSGTGEIFRIEEDGSKSLLATLTPGLDNLAFNSEGRLFVSSYADGFIAEILPSGQTRWVSPPGPSMIGSTLISERNGRKQLLVTDYYSLKYYDIETGDLTHATRGIVNFPGGLGTVLSASPAGEKLLLTSWIDQQIKLWDDTTGTLHLSLRNMGAPIDGVLFNGDIVYSDSATNTVYSLSPSTSDKPTRMARFKSRGTPAGLAVTPEGSLYLTEFGGPGRLLLLADEGQWLREPREIANGLNKAEGVEIVENQAFIVETGIQSLSVVTLDSGKKTVIADNLKLGLPAPPGFPPTMLFSGVAVDATGVAYVTGDVGHVIYRITPQL